MILLKIMSIFHQEPIYGTASRHEHGLNRYSYNNISIINDCRLEQVVVVKDIDEVGTYVEFQLKL